jgi:hypothetical protein
MVVSMNGMKCIFTLAAGPMPKDAPIAAKKIGEKRWNGSCKAF